MAIQQTARQKQADEHRRDLFDAARELFMQYGVDVVTIDDICARCGVTKGTFYHNFPSKDHVITLTVNSMLDTYIAQHYEIRQNMDLCAQITELLMNAFTFFKELGKDMTRRSYEAQVRSSVEVRIEGRAFVDSLSALVDRGLRENAFLMDIDRLNTYMMFIATYTGILMKWSTQSDDLDAVIDWENIVREQVKLMVHEKEPPS